MSCPVQLFDEVSSCGFEAKPLDHPPQTEQSQPDCMNDQIDLLRDGGSKREMETQEIRS